MGNKGKYLLGVLILFFSASCAQEDQFYPIVRHADVFTQQYQEAKYDFLWVFDNSGSMKDRIAYVRDNFQRFLGILTTRKAIDFQMAAVTGDLFWDNGKLVSSSTGLKVVKSTSSDPIGDFVSIVKNVVDTPTSFWDQDLEAAYQAIYQHGSEFMRDEANLILIFVTDADDYSCQANCSGVEPRHNTNYTAFPMERYVNYFQNVKTSANTTTALYPIIGLHSSKCIVEDYGMRYLQLAVQMGGVLGSVCGEEIAQAYDNVAKAIGDRGTHFPLSSTASGKGIHVFIDGVVVPPSEDSGYYFDKPTNSIVFTGKWVPRKGAEIAVTYDQLIN